MGHEGDSCPYPDHSIKDFAVVDISGIHTITLRFCACVGAPHARNQLLAASWFPASLDRPQTAFTFDVLDTFQLLNLQGKISAFDFYYSLDHKTDNTGVCSVQVHISITEINAVADVPRTDTINFSPLSEFFGILRCLNEQVAAMIPLAST